jgi:uncharacterized protein (UPF0333 family)
MAKKKKKPQSELQFRFSLTLVVVMMCLVGAYFVQSFLEIRQEKPVRVAYERITDRVAESREKKVQETAEKLAPKSDP